MANGPPTPPPSTEAEIQDEARNPAENVVPATTPQPSAQQQDDAYQSAFPAIADLALQLKFRELIQLAETSELNSDADSDRRITRLLVTAPLVLAPRARFALGRLPENVSSGPLGRALSELLAATTERKHASVYSRADNLSDMVNKPDFYDEKLAPVLSGLLSSFVGSFRQRTVALLAKAYTSLPVSLAQVYLGMKQDDLLAAAQNAQWSYDPSKNVLVPQVPSSAPSTIPELSTTFSSLSTFHFVANSVAKLEL
ncbi:hypothetical protein D9615_004111 [Tricholomella constricta]|uniref:CSN8/PSMD8/EIF3K domain-containing protein n=1 Tax=Tricholomella constricta TaxID=117010 RepID=A0A8H5HCH5_9AGAR|nr:hypothetical protein D9615_004111 [Tricholomella constricta]